MQGSPDYGYEAWKSSDVAPMVEHLDLVVASGYGAVDLTKLPDLVDCRGVGSNMQPCPSSSTAIIRRAAEGWGSSGIVPMSKLVIGLNWYAIDYPLSKKPTEVNARISFCEAANLAASLPEGAVAWDENSSSWLFNHTNTSSGEPRQMWFDDEISLGVKYALARSLGFRGVGMWKASGMWRDSHAGEAPGYSSLWLVQHWCPERIQRMWASVRKNFTEAAGVRVWD